MKKILSLVLALAMILTAVCALADGPADEAVDTGAVGAGAGIGGDEQMEHPDALPAVAPPFPEPAFRLAHLDGILIKVAGVVLLLHDIGDEFVKRFEGAELPAFLPVSEAPLVNNLCHGDILRSVWSLPHAAASGLTHTSHYYICRA